VLVPLLSTTLVPGPDRVVVRLSGEVDLSTAPRLREALLRSADAGAARVVVDVARAVFWDCSGLHELARFTDDLARDGRHCRIVRATPATRRLIGLANYAPLLRLDGPLDDPNISLTAEDRLPGLPARPPSADLPDRPATSERPTRARRRAFDLLMRTPATPATSVAGRRWS
jgi:anti-anti-sigma factor